MNYSMNYAIIYYGYQVSSKVSKFQSFKRPKFRSFQDYKIPRFPDSHIPKSQNFKLSKKKVKIQSLTVSNLQTLKFQNPIFHNSCNTTFPTRSMFVTLRYHKYVFKFILVFSCILKCIYIKQGSRSPRNRRNPTISGNAIN